MKLPRLCIACALALSCHAALAQSSPPELPTSPPQRPLWELGLGVAALRLPDYRGSDESRAYVLPLPFVAYRGRFFKADREGARAELLNTAHFKVDVSVAASTPVRSQRNAARAGMPALPGTVELGPNFSVELLSTAGRSPSLELRLPVRAAITLERSPRVVGATFAPHLNLDLSPAAGGWSLGLQAGPLFGNRRHHRQYYTVGAEDATAQRPAFEAAGGYAGWNALAATSRRLGNTWVGAFARYDQLRGAVFQHSPLVRSTSGLTLGLGVSWVLAASSEQVASAD
jgi:MipA family protein